MQSVLIRRSRAAGLRFARGRCNRLIRISTDTEINVKAKPERLSVAEKDIRCTI